MNQYNYYKPGGFGGFSFFPPVIKNLLIINGVVFFIQLLAQNMSFGGVLAENILLRWFALMPIGGGFEFWQLISYQFMHGGFMHILFNMFVLWMFGMEIENIFGSKKFLYFYLLAGVIAGIFHLLISPLFGTGLAPTIGASGAIFGVMTVFAFLFPNRYIFLYFFIPIKAKYLITFIIVMEIMLVDSANSTIAHLAHLGGALTGFIWVLMDPSIHAEIKNIFRRQSFRTKTPFNPLGNIKDKFTKKSSNIEDAQYYEVKDSDDKENVSQEEIDKILDKISQSGYQNLTEREKRVLFEASKKMK